MEFERKEPWLVEQANNILKEFIENPVRILEFGSGFSTLWFLQQENVIELVSVEHSNDWFIKVQSQIKTEKKHTLIRKDTPYNDICDDYLDEYFDIILVDGRNRNKCMQSAIPKLKKGGVLILDNSERDYYHLGYDLMKDWEQFTVEQNIPDKYGFTYKDPINGRFWSTSFFKNPM